MERDISMLKIDISVTKRILDDRINNKDSMVELGKSYREITDMHNAKYTD